MGEDVALDLPEKEQGQGAGIGMADGAGLHGPAEVIGEEAQHAAGGNFLAVRVERHDQRGGVHLHGDGRADDGAEERDGAAGELPQHISRIGGGVDHGQGQGELRDGNGPRAHGGAEEGLLGVEVAEDGRGRDLERPGDVGQGGGGEAAGAEGGPGGVEDLVLGDPGWTAHL